MYVLREWDLSLHLLHMPGGKIILGKMTDILGENEGGSEGPCSKRNTG